MCLCTCEVHVCDFVTVVLCLCGWMSANICLHGYVHVFDANGISLMAEERAHVSKTAGVSQRQRKFSMGVVGLGLISVSPSRHLFLCFHTHSTHTYRVARTIVAAFTALLSSPLTGWYCHQA